MPATPRTPLPPDDIARRLERLPGWRLSDDGRAIEQSFRFADFGAAFAFMTRVALAAERADHHPDWRNIYDRVDIRLWSHDAGGLTVRDFALAERIESLAGAV